MKTIILISGKMRSGKNQFAEYVNLFLMKRAKSSRMDLFAKDLKRGCEEDFEYMMKQINSHILKIKEELQYSTIDSNSLKAAVTMLDDLMVTRTENWYEDKTLMSRLILQTYGTQIFRDRVNKNYWVDKVIKRVFECEEQFTLVTDARFENEIDYVKSSCANNDMRVLSVRIERDIPQNKLYEHDSEKGLDNYKEWDFILYNKGNLEDLKKSAENFVNSIIKEN